MRETYEAVLSRDHVEWVGPAPVAGRHRVLVTVLDSLPLPLDEVRHVLDDTRGAWGDDRSQARIDADLAATRAEWDRPWDDPDEPTGPEPSR